MLGGWKGELLGSFLGASVSAEGSASPAAAEASVGLGLGTLRNDNSTKSASQAAAAADAQSWGVTVALLLGTAEAIVPPVLLAGVAETVRFLQSRSVDAHGDGQRLAGAPAAAHALEEAQPRAAAANPLRLQLD
ncbi:hypothetical protein cyc_01087 [Cyclospora cayetanensis]|uniref:Uncharacterized protein n=1 Tax=Cyclospora cayetanensis TaxID=88456 RepID=A0A1D3D3A8_9EIME|nr:hypothetical protein cyc_01087 [Cyclospora cayetanensis]